MFLVANRRVPPGDARRVPRSGPGYPPARVLSEVEAVQRGLARPEVGALLEGEVDVARSDVLAARRLPNPAVSYAREDSSAATTDSLEDLFWLTQRVDLSGRRGLHTEAAQRRVDATGYETERRRLEIEAEIRRRFFEALYRETRIQVVRLVRAHADRSGHRATAGSGG